MRPLLSNLIDDRLKLGAARRRLTAGEFALGLRSRTGPYLISNGVYPLDLIWGVGMVWFDPTREVFAASYLRWAELSSSSGTSKISLKVHNSGVLLVILYSSSLTAWHPLCVCYVRKQGHCPVHLKGDLESITEFAVRSFRGHHTR